MRYLCAGLAFLLAGACATPYQSEGWSGGFSEVPLASDTYQISFNGNGYTARSKAREMAMLRAAELTKQNGFEYFIVLDTQDSVNTSTYTTPGSSQTNTTTSATAYGYGNTATAYGQSNSITTYNPPTVEVVSKPQTDLVIRFVPLEFAKQSNALSVQQVYSLYASKYGLE